LKKKSKRKTKRTKTSLHPRPAWHYLALLGAVLLLVIYYSLLPNGAEFRSENPKTTSLIQARAAAAYESKKAFNPTLRWVAFSKISPNLIKSIIVAEDSRFYEHHGLDFGEIWNAITDAIVGFHFPRGASTITQQLAKNLYLSESKNPLRKLSEAIIATKLEHNLSKQRILELYLNLIEWGEGTFGVEAAAQRYFGQNAEDLSDGQAAFLAAIIPGPRRAFNPDTHPRRVLSRKALIERRVGKKHSEEQGPPVTTR
jgi:monofunctional glycosyltransferase